jgi:hypothetical protein
MSLLAPLPPAGRTVDSVRRDLVWRRLKAHHEIIRSHVRDDHHRFLVETNKKLHLKGFEPLA